MSRFTLDVVNLSKLKTPRRGRPYRPQHEPGLQVGQMKNDQGDVVGSVSKTVSSQESQFAVPQESFVTYEEAGPSVGYATGRVIERGYMLGSSASSSGAGPTHGGNLFRWSCTAPNLCSFDCRMASRQRRMVSALRAQPTLNSEYALNS